MAPQPIIIPKSAHKLIADGMYFGESPRYCPTTKQIYMSDMIGRKIYLLDPSTQTKDVLVDVPNQPNGLCIHPVDGSLIYSSMFDAKLHRYRDDKHELFADLAGVMTGYCGDMVIDAKGRVYIDDTGARVLHGEKPCPGRLLVVEDGRVSVAEEQIIFPNGIAIDNSGTSLYISETFAYRFNKFNIDPETGKLSQRTQIWDTHECAELIGKDFERFSAVDGICIDAEDGIWLSMLGYETFIRRDRDGNVTHRIDVDGHATACCLGGDDGKTLFLVTNKMPEGMDLFTAMVEKKTRCEVTAIRVNVGKGKALP